MADQQRMVLYTSENDCCGCGACANICPKAAIQMQPDEFGFVYPVLDQQLCTRCGLCKKTCGFRREELLNSPNKAYAGMIKDSELLKKSASGGIFACLSLYVLRQKGVVYGCAMQRKQGVLSPQHIKIENEKDLQLLQGSKYAQSDMGYIYREIRDLIKTQRKVLFSGTPCQVAALKSFLNGKEYENLWTIDIICHGVPNTMFFSEYIKQYEKKHNISINNFCFRDKEHSWGYTSRIDYSTKKAKQKTVYLSEIDSSFYHLFLSSKILRSSCYSCPYAGEKRSGDISIGDYWGIEKEHPEALISEGGNIQVRKGVSCIMVNSSQGDSLFRRVQEGIELVESQFEKMARWNNQLRHPSDYPEDRDHIMAIFKNGGYSDVERWYKKSMGSQWYRLKIKEVLITKPKRLLKKIIKM